MMDPQDDTGFADQAIKRGFAKLEQIEECLALQERISQAGLKPKSLGELLLAKGYIDRRQLEEIQAAMRDAGADHEKGDSRAPWPSKIAGYEIRELIGEGAVGAVFKALQVSMDRIVAIKILSRRHSQNERMREKFLSEARTAAKLSHPNIVQAIDVGQEQGYNYFVMEYLDGPTVGHLLKRGGPLDEKRALNIVLQVARALDYAHRHGIVHRDIKPDNIMMTREGIVKLCDLGLARAVHDPDQVRAGIIAGTPYYMSPEQARGETQLDGRNDIYSLGASFYHMVCGEVPFPGDTAAAVVAKHLTEPLVPPRQRQPLVSEAANHVICKMMAKDKDERYSSAAELIRDLEAVLEGHPPQGMKRQTVTGRKIKRPLRRRRRLRRR